MITRGVRNNNPFNIKISTNRWKGKVLKASNTDGVFEQFVSMKYGLRAGVILLRNYQLRYGIWTIQAFIERFAPSSENNIDNYIKFVCNFLRGEGYFVSPQSTIVFGSFEFYHMCRAICEFESRFKVSYSDLKAAYEFDFKEYK